MARQRAPTFRGRSSERHVLDRLLGKVRSGESAALVLRGEAGAGKSALLRYGARQASGFRVLEIAGVESEMELPNAALHQLCAPLLDRLGDLPPPQQEALRIAFGQSHGGAPDRFVVALAVLSLVAEVATERPLLCLIDDAQWLDRTSALVLGFVARRLGAESVAMLFGVREPLAEPSMGGLPELRVEGLIDTDARSLLEAVVAGRLDDRVRDRIVAETRGNPLALLELVRGTTAAELAGDSPFPPLATCTSRSRTSTGAACAASPVPRGVSSSWRPPTPRATRPSCGAPPRRSTRCPTMPPRRRPSSC
jgi:hypothetical protein